MLLRMKLGSETENEAGWEELFEELDYLPLAIVQAASYIRQNSWNVLQYVKHFRDKDGKDLGTTLKLLMHDFGDKHREKSITNAVLKTWIITMEQLEAQFPQSAEILRRMAFLDRQNIPRCLLDSQLCSDDPNEENIRDNGQEPSATQPLIKQDAIEFDTAIGKLKAYSFITASQAGSSTRQEHYTIHRLVQLFTRHWLHSQKRNFDTILSDTLTRLYCLFPSHDEPEKWLLRADLLPHVLPVIISQPSPTPDPRKCALLLYQASTFLDEKGQYLRARDYIRRAIILSREQPCPLPLQLRLKGCLATTLVGNGDLDDAIEVQSQIIEECETLLGPDHRRILFDKSFLGRIMTRQGKYEEAESLIREASQRYESLYSSNEDEAILIKYFLTMPLLKLGRLVEAEQNARDVLDAGLKVNSPVSTRLLHFQGDLGQILSKRNKFEEAEIVLRKTVERASDFWGREHPHTLEYMRILAELLDRFDRSAEAEKLYMRTLYLQEKVLGPQQTGTLSTIRGIADCLSTQGRFQEASTFAQRALHGYESNYGATDSRTMECLSQLQGISQRAQKEQQGSNHKPDRGVLKTVKRILGSAGHS